MLTDVGALADILWSVTPGTNNPIADTPADTSVAGLQDKREKVLPRANTGDTTSSPDSELGDHEIGSSPRKNESTEPSTSCRTYPYLSWQLNGTY